MQPSQQDAPHERANARVLFRLTAFVCCLSSAGLAATPTIGYVQGNYSAPQSPQTTVTVTFIAAQAAGDLNVIVAGWNDSAATVTAVTDRSGNVYSRAVGPTVVSGSLSQSIYYAKNIKAASAGANAVTVTFSAPAAYPDIRILEYSNADPSSPVDVVAASSGNSTNSNSGSVATANATDLIFGANMVVTTTNGPGTGFTARLLTSPDSDLAEDQMVATTGNYSASAPLASAGPWIMQMVAFKAAGAISACDVNQDGPVNVVDTQLAINMNLGSSPCTVNIGGFPVCTAAFVNVVTNTALGSACITPVLSANPSSINFGNVTIGGSNTQTASLTNPGNGNLTVSSATVTGTGFGIAGMSLPLTLGPGQSTSFNVTFAPPSSGTAAGNITFASTALNSLINAPLSGTGVVAHSVSLSWTASTSSNVTGYNVYRGSASGGPYAKVNSALVAGTSYNDSGVPGGQTYYYVATAVDSNNTESTYSNQAQAVVPLP